MVVHSTHIELYSKKYVYQVSAIDSNNISLNLNNVGYIEFEDVKKSSIAMYKARELSLLNSSLSYIKSTYIGKLELYQTKLHYMYGYVSYVDNSNSLIQEFKSVLYNEEISLNVNQCMLEYVLKNIL